MINRFFGKKKKDVKGPSLDDAVKSMESRGDEMDKKIEALDRELAKYKAQLAKARGPAKRAIQQRALQVLKKKKIYEKQRDLLGSQQFNVDQTRFAQSNLKDTATTVAAMKTAQAELKTTFNDVNIDEIEDLQDDMADLMQDNEEIQEIMGRTYGVPDELDEEDLLNELDALDELEPEENEEVPAYLVSAASAANKNVDEHGMPQVPAHQIEI